MKELQDKIKELEAMHDELTEDNKELRRRVKELEAVINKAVEDLDDVV